MQYSVFLLVLGALLTALLTPLAIGCARLLGAIDCPDGGRHLHACPTPRLGGLALFLSSLLISLAFLPMDAKAAAWLSGSGLLTALGVTDDLYTLPPLPKLCALSAIASLPIAFGLAPASLSLGAAALPLSPPYDNIFCLFWVLLLTNAFNLIDGADGLAVTLTLSATLSIFFSCAAPAALLLLGTALGFLPYNLPARTSIAARRAPTRSFLGDTGALFLGYSLAVFSLGERTFSLFTLFAVLLPVYDLVRVFLDRLLRGKNPFHADRTHLHHRLLARGYRAGEMLFYVFLISLLFSLLSLFLPLLFP